jgi:phage major head subunit gpT-like protein
MANPLISAAFPDCLDVSIRDLASGQYDLGKSRIGDFFTIKDSDRATEKYSSLTPLGKLSTFTDAITYLDAAQEYDVTATHVEMAGGVQIKRALYDDDQFGVIKEYAQQLGDSGFKTQEDDAASLLTGAFSVPAAFFNHTENVALCSNSHTSGSSGVSTTTGFDNLVTTALSPTALSAARLQFKGFKDASGWKLGLIPNRLIVPDDLEDKAHEIVNSIQVPYEASNTKNVNDGRFEVYVHPRLNDSNDWFLANTDLMKKSFYWFWRVKFETARMEGFDNITAKWRCYLRYSFLRRDWRAILGSQVT